MFISYSQNIWFSPGEDTRTVGVKGLKRTGGVKTENGKHIASLFNVNPNMQSLLYKIPVCDVNLFILAIVEECSSSGIINPGLFPKTP